jgi:hypothetical protein
MSIRETKHEMGRPSEGRYTKQREEGKSGNRCKRGTCGRMFMSWSSSL